MSLQQLFGDIADAIREKDGTTTPITARDFPERIRRLSAPAAPNIYGVEWDGTSTTEWTRTDASAEFASPVVNATAHTFTSPFDNLMPWSGMTLTTDAVAGELVEIPRFWYKLAKNGDGLKIQIADAPSAGFATSPAHMDRGDGKGERAKVYIGKAFCGNPAVSSSTKTNIKRSEAREGIHALGDTIWQCDFAMRFTLWLLYLVEFANWNSQAALANVFIYHNIAGLTTSSEYFDGCYYDPSGFYIVLNPSHFNDDCLHGQATGMTIAENYGGYPSAFEVSSSGGFPMFYPTAYGGSDSTYTTDKWQSFAGTPCVYGGGAYTAADGLFAVSHASKLYSSAGVTARLMKLP